MRCFLILALALVGCGQEEIPKAKPKQQTIQQLGDVPHITPVPGCMPTSPVSEYVEATLPRAFLAYQCQELRITYEFQDADVSCPNGTVGHTMAVPKNSPKDFRFTLKTNRSSVLFFADPYCRFPIKNITLYAGFAWLDVYVAELNADYSNYQAVKFDVIDQEGKAAKSLEEARRIYRNASKEYEDYIAPKPL